MENPTTFAPHTVAPETFVLPSYLPIPGLGLLPVNAFLIRGQEPLLIDTGLLSLRGQFLEQVSALVDLDDLRWIWLTHTDHDHIGSLSRILEAAPQARVITTFVGMGKMALHQPLPPDRVYLLNPGQVLDLGDRRVSALRPPTFDAPETTMVLDHETGALFSSDAFGATLQTPHERAEDIESDELRTGLVQWVTLDSPWLHLVDESRLRVALQEVRNHAPRTILSAHLPPAMGMTDHLLGLVDAARHAPAFVGPDQQALIQMMAAVA